jgi:NAD-dependent dihydropyrimidine dehydrogenase PreA subunit
MTMSWKVTVDQTKCVGCGSCMDACPVEVYEVKQGKAVPVQESECLGCQSCVEVCNEGALSVEEQ